MNVSPYHELNRIMSRHEGIADLLANAGMDPAYIRRDRAFSSQWGWTDGDVVVATIWIDEVQDPAGIPKWGQSDPSARQDLHGPRRGSAEALFNMLRTRAGQAIRVVLQSKKADRSKSSSGVAEHRGLDPEPWYVSVEGSEVLVQRGQPVGRKTVSVDGREMESRPPSLALRETRPEQAGFRQRVAAKTGNRCALTGAPPEVCDAAHFAWVNWRTDNNAWHGVLLRRDLHAALDAGLLTIDQTGLVVVSEYLALASQEYAQLHGRVVGIGNPASERDAS